MKNKFIKSTIILIIGGLISKILGMFIKIILTRTITTKGIGIYSLILPTFNLLITLCTLGLPIAISKLISEQKQSSKTIILSVLPLALLFNILLIITIYLVAPFISNNLLHNKDTLLPLISMSLTLPFICISSILKGYFFGKEKMFPTTLSNITEQITRLFLTLTIVSKLMKHSLTYAITGVVLINIISESISIITLLLFLPKKQKIEKKDFYYNNKIIKNLLNISIPTTGSRLIGSISFFLEPIILTLALTKTGYSKEFIIQQYGIINGYVYPLLLLPSFFTQAISSALLPIISHSYANKNHKYSKYKIKQAIYLSLGIGIPCTLILMLKSPTLLSFIYHTDQGIIYIKMIAPIFLLYYIQGPLTASMQAMNQAKKAMLGTLYGSIIRTTLLFFLSFLKIGLWGLIISECTNIIFTTIHHLYYVQKNL